MLRYLKAAFWARPGIPGLGRLPINALALAGLVILGFGHPALWLLGLGLETLYLFLLCSSPRFRTWVDAIHQQAGRGEIESQRASMLAQLPAAARKRHQDLLGLNTRILEHDRRLRAEDFLIQSNTNALDKLALLHLKLLLSGHYLEQHQRESGAEDLDARIREMEASLADPAASASLQESRRATLGLLRQRRANQDRRDAALAEIASDLARIEAQVRLSLDQALLRGEAGAVSGHIDLASRLLDDADYLDAHTAAAAAGQAYSAPPTAQTA